MGENATKPSGVLYYNWLWSCLCYMQDKQAWICQYSCRSQARDVGKSPKFFSSSFKSGNCAKSLLLLCFTPGSERNLLSHWETVMLSAAEKPNQQLTTEMLAVGTFICIIAKWERQLKCVIQKQPLLRLFFSLLGYLLPIWVLQGEQMIWGHVWRCSDLSASAADWW